MAERILKSGGGGGGGLGATINKVLLVTAMYLKAFFITGRNHINHDYWGNFLFIICIQLWEWHECG